MKDYLIYFAQAYPNFRRAELESLADLYNIPLDLSHHDEASPFIIVQLENDHQAKQLLARSILSRGIYELYGQGESIDKIHEQIKALNEKLDAIRHWNQASFKFDFIGYMGGRSNTTKVDIINLFRYLPLEGKIQMKNPDQVFTVLEEYVREEELKQTIPVTVWFGRQIQLSARVNNILDKYDLKQRKYIGTTSFEAELSLVTCNIGQVAPGKLVYDPFAGTGSFLVAAAEFGGYPLGSDIDIRILRGNGKDRDIRANFNQYNTLSQFVDVLTMDFTHSALRNDIGIQCIVCDPPYGVREGLKVCGAKDPERAAGREKIVIDGELAHLKRDFIQPKKPYDLANLLADLLEFSANTLPIGGRLAFWMPTANDDFEPHLVPQHQQLRLVYNLEQEFNKWSRRLLVYTKEDSEYEGVTSNGLKMHNIRNFRERYFHSFSDDSR
ncbi:uncharacterized protein KQ657_001677 [Scheffersomyces spartinae]|uniref:tRNA (guanine(10)-N(2))-methyltransferase n=1 Tax=Scheffersomyces spartinae TaxID=45513 RepID=A0A9P7V7C5_9ASCO|nr:uncharacterized protein KQ657_001677 [Scheffersomyces spartinae]KAG7192577.1 hypothetical protein KQ657_001677 [Scheffersomyces spartinae]